MYLDLWYPASFNVRGCVFDSIGHYIAYRRAIAVKDVRIANYIKNEHERHLIRTLGDSCIAEETKTWDASYPIHLEDAIRAKFMQNADLLEVFLTSHDIVRSAYRSKNDDIAKYVILKVHAEFMHDRVMKNWIRRKVR